MLALITTLSILFTFITWKNLHHGIFLICFLLPTYLLRFSIGPLPSTFLEVMLLISFAIALLKHRPMLLSGTQALWKNHTSLVVATGIFLLGATISVFAGVDLRAAAGEWKAFYIEPALFGLLLWSILHSEKNKTLFLKKMSFALILSGIMTSALAIYQHFTGWMVPHAFWANRDTYRVTGWFGYPNAVGLFLSPLMPLAMWLIHSCWCGVSRLEHWIKRVSLLFLPMAALSLWYAKSTGAMVGIVGAIGILLLIWKKTRIAALTLGVIGLIGLILIPAENPIKQELLMQDRSGQIRVFMWKDTLELLKDRPILGSGMAAHATRIEPYHSMVHGENIEIFHLPHNLMLSIWVNTGIIGLIGFITLLILLIARGLKTLPDKRAAYSLAILTVLLVTGLVDTPYIKNDLAVMFWVFVVLLLVKQQSVHKSIV